jgi:uncharacterized Ntn-hydrolase superfamily protein
MTYAVVARCPRTGQFGIGIASYSLAIGRYTNGALRANTGATQTLGTPYPRNNYLAIDLLAQGRTANQVLGELVANDPQSSDRQIAIVDREGTAVAHSGARLSGFAGHRLGAGFAAFGDTLVGPEVLDALETAFERAAGAELDERLLAALEAAQDAGGQRDAAGRLPERSAAMVIWGNRTYNEIDLRVDRHDSALRELRRIHADYKPSVAYYEERARHPRNAIPAMEFADMLKRQQQGGAAP